MSCERNDTFINDFIGNIGCGYWNVHHSIQTHIHIFYLLQLLQLHKFHCKFFSKWYFIVPLQCILYSKCFSLLYKLYSALKRNSKIYSQSYLHGRIIAIVEYKARKKDSDNSSKNKFRCAQPSNIDKSK